MKTVCMAFYKFARDLSWPLAWSALKNLLQWIGLLALIAYFGSAKILLAVPSILFLAALWLLLYKFEYGWRWRRTFGRQEG